VAAAIYRLCAVSASAGNQLKTPRKSGRLAEVFQRFPAGRSSRLTFWVFAVIYDASFLDEGNNLASLSWVL
jgi:hypothetical protein